MTKAQNWPLTFKAEIKEKSCHLPHFFLAEKEGNLQFQEYCCTWVFLRCHKVNGHRSP